MVVEYVPPKISPANRCDPMDVELEAIQRRCLTSWSEHEIIQRIEHVRHARSVERSRLLDIELISTLPAKTLNRLRKASP
jgi:hypothetical protein